TRSTSGRSPTHRSAVSTEKGRRAAVLGKPVAHSLSPLLHDAAYRALGLTEFSYERVEVSEAELPRFVAGLGSEWAGLAVTMPGKRPARACSQAAGERARAIGAANALVQGGAGVWYADSTDIDGVRGARRITAGVDDTVGGAAAILGGGGTAAAGVGAFAELGLRSVRLVVRGPTR